MNTDETQDKEEIDIDNHMTVQEQLEQLTNDIVMHTLDKDQMDR